MMEFRGGQARGGKSRAVGGAMGGSKLGMDGEQGRGHGGGAGAGAAEAEAEDEDETETETEGAGWR